MELAEESEHQRMGIFPSKAKVTAQGPWQTMEVFIRSSAPSPLNVCENVEKQSWPWYPQANSCLRKKLQSRVSHSGHNAFQIPALLHEIRQIMFPAQLSQLTGFQGSSFRSKCLRVSHVSMYTHTSLVQISKAFKRHTKCCQREPKPTNPSSTREYILQPCATAGAVDSSLSQLPWGSTGP